MPVFFVIDPAKGYVTPLSDQLRLRKILAPDELNETRRIHEKLETLPEQYRLFERRAKDDQTEQTTSNQTTKNDQRKAARQYQQTAQTDETPRSSTLQAIKAKHLMSTPVIQIDISETLEKAWGMMQAHGIHHLAITSTEYDSESPLLQGILSEKRLLPLLMNQENSNFQDLPLRDFCTIPIIAATPETGFYELAEVILEHSIDGLPITEGRQLSGMITTSDILKALLRKHREQV